MSFRRYGKNDKVIVVYRDRTKALKVERGQIISSGADQPDTSADMYRYDVRTRWGTLSDFTSLNVLDACCLPVKAAKGEDGWSEVSLSNHSQELIREYVNILTSLETRHRKVLRAKESELLLRSRECDFLKQRTVDLARQVAVLQRQLATQTRMRGAEAINTNASLKQGDARKRKLPFSEVDPYAFPEEPLEPLIKREAPSPSPKPTTATTSTSTSSSSGSGTQSIQLTKKPVAAPRFAVNPPSVLYPGRKL